MTSPQDGVDNQGFEGSVEDLNANSRTEENLESGTTKPLEDQKGTWGHGIEFLMSCIAMSVGLGNIWRFPFTAYENGGGAFLIPYIIVLTLIGRPLYYMEMALGQFSSRGNVKMFEALAPAVKGIGYGQLLGTICVATYYCSLMAITIFYLINSFTSDLPWASCDPQWDTGDKVCVSSKDKGSTVTSNTISSSELWFTKEVTKEKSQIDDGIGWPDWRLTLTLLLGWAITFAVSVKGVQSSGKAAYFLALFPYVVMITLLVRACTLEGSGDGMLYFIKPQWDKLASAEVWYNAVTQCFFSLNVGFGSIIMYSSYNSFEHNIYRDAVIVSVMDTFTSILAGATIFAILGNLAFELNVEVEDVINTGGTGLAFISYPEAIAKFDAVPWLFAILFFVMLLTLGIGSLVALQGSANIVILEAFPKLKNWQVSAGTAICGFIIGLVYVTPGGQSILNLVDHFGGNFIILTLVIAEIYVVMWWYGLQNFCDDVEFMLKTKVGIYWRVTWGILTPILLLIIYIYFLATYKTITYGSMEYPDSALACGWLILAVGIVQALMWIVYYIHVNKNLGFPEMVSKAFTDENWGPKRKDAFEEWKKYKEAKKLERPQNTSGIRKLYNVILGR